METVFWAAVVGAFFGAVLYLVARAAGKRRDSGEHNVRMYFRSPGGRKYRLPPHWPTPMEPEDYVPRDRLDSGDF